ncbi:short-chain dehydrogenase [Burkholderia cepacia JBK9]|uniref:SDR family oxidoreductase n=2 Tax=Pseudomonadota TaxID=1224 RepID=A0A9Q9SQS1_9BURK|nr:SDR family oxidoreductase [Burkholderia arboris]ALX16863.1 short-chain dehydrogenase [Burkholderia cepacia JBK9]MCA8489263.1 SDR family oxidoreductase [Burkholderia arboris]UTV59779.1 SDR family NAD(P)-dependent oxidoreductase [Burkholderia arboris]VWC39626.1 short chain dehydrogenase [Burkholderia arboris]
MKLKGKVALVTGGSQGIGEAVARALSQEGAIVAVVASSSVEKAVAVARTLGAAEGRAKGYAADVRDADAMTQLAKEIVADFGRIDILVNCAGVFVPTPIESDDKTNMNNTVDINVKGTWNAISAVVPEMKRNQYGKIVNIASVCGVMGFGSFAAYCATKAAVIMLTKTLVFELAPHGININAIGPGNTATPINEYIRKDPEYASVLKEIVDQTPSGNAYSSPEDIAQIALFLVSDAARAMHGSFVLADEGYSAGADFTSD